MSYSKCRLRKVGPVAYRLDLSKELNSFHDTFHVLNLKNCLANPTLQVPLDEIRVDAKLNFVEELVEILEREFKKLKHSRIAIVKVRWNSKRGPEFTWECEDQMKLKYPHLFSDAATMPRRGSAAVDEDPTVLSPYSIYKNSIISLMFRALEDVFNPCVSPTENLLWILNYTDGVNRVKYGMHKVTWCNVEEDDRSLYLLRVMPTQSEEYPSGPRVTESKDSVLHEECQLGLLKEHLDLQLLMRQNRKPERTYLKLL
ncbi:hypothetical protein Tco_0594732 [Tanacetum coccineum]